MHRRVSLFILFTFLVCSLCLHVTAQEGYHKWVIKDGIRVDVSLFHLNSKYPDNEFREGEVVRFRFRITDTISGKGLAGVSPAAWMNREKTSEKVECGKKIKSFIEGGFLSRPELDLNAYLVLTLNGDNTINVVNPLFGFGGSQLLAQIQIPAPGYDWVLTENQSLVFVSMPVANQVSVIGTREMKIIKNLDLPGQPGKMVLQADERYLWVTYNNAEKFETKSGVAVFDIEKNLLVKNIPTGNGPHEIIIDEENKHAYISNNKEGSISIINMNTLDKMKDVELKDELLSMAWSSKAQALYVVKKNSPLISVLDGKNYQVIKEIKAETGIKKICFSPGGRNGFVINPKNNTVNIIDAAQNRIVQTADVEPQPNEINFTDQLAYVSHLGSEIISMIPLDGIGKEGVPVSVAEFSGGKNPPAYESPECAARIIVQAPGDNSVLVSNFKDESIYYYQEGMAAPMGSFNTYGKNPKAVMVIDRSIKEKADGVYETVAKLTSPGMYDLALFINVPLIMECFQIKVLPDSVKVKERLLSTMGALVVKSPSINTRPAVGETVIYKFQISDINTGQPVSGLTDIHIMDVMTTQNKHSQTAAAETDIKGTYVASLRFNDEGLYYLYIECPSRGLEYNNSQYRIVYASKK